MNLTSAMPFAYTPGKCTYGIFIRGSEGWQHHQNPFLYPYADGRLFMVWGASVLQ
ncbi:MAG: hypothetical protein O2954_08325 [bacterium]|nr:hypothetical protein [bacterium]